MDIKEVNVFTEDYRYATAPDWQHNIQTFSIIKVFTHKLNVVNELSPKYTSYY